MRPGIEWDDRKAKFNWRKHGISFEEAATVFDDPLAITFPDPDHSESEDRDIILGMSALGSTILIVVHVSRGNNLRIISARRATNYERLSYEEGETH